MSRVRTCGAALALVGALAQAGRAQADRAVYVQYEGFIKNSNGTLTVSFGYFNLNDTDVTIEAGERNGFLPPPANRNQPTTFLKGRHRFACVMVLPAGFDGNLRWRVDSGGTISTTTARVLDSNYALEDASASRATAGLTLDTAPRSTCLATPVRDSAAPAASAPDPLAGDAQR
jgi:hypothetical protein